MLELLTNKEKDNLNKWSYSVDDPSITTQLLTPFWNTVVNLVPDYVSPNVLSLSGLLLLVYAYYITYLYSSAYPRTIALVSALLLFSYQTLDAIDGKHARRIKNDSPLGELFDHACDSIGIIFVILTVATTLGISSPTILFYITQSGLMLFLLEHLKAFRTRKVTFFAYMGPGEILLFCVSILLWKFATGWSLIPQALLHTKLFGVVFFMAYWSIYIYSVVYTAFGIDLIDTINVIMEGFVTNKINNMPEDDNKLITYDKVFSLWYDGNHVGTKIGILLCLFMRHINGILLYQGLISAWSLQDVIAHGLVLSVVISDLIVAKMAQRHLHPMVVVGSMISIFNHNLLIFILTAVYYLKIFNEICDSMELSLFTPTINVYVDGVWDLLHIGHMQHYDRASGFGNRLIVGVISDEDATSYKRRPTLSMEERATAASYIKGVGKVVRNVPLCITKDFILEHNIGKVFASKEYDDPDDKYYAVPRKMGILHIVDRVEGISTSELMERVRNNSNSNGNSNSDKDSNSNSYGNNNNSSDGNGSSNSGNDEDVILETSLDQDLKADKEETE